MTEVSKVGKRGAVVIPASLRRRLGIEEGTLVTTEEREGGVLIRPVVAVPAEEYRAHFFSELERAYHALREDSVAWDEEQFESRSLEGTLMDGLDPDEVWTDDGDVVRRVPEVGNGSE